MTMTTTSASFALAPSDTPLPHVVSVAPPVAHPTRIPLCLAVSADRALQAVALELLDDHLGHCVAEASAQGGPVAQEKLREASAAIARLVRS